MNTYPIKLYGVSRKHPNPNKMTLIEEKTFNIIRADKDHPFITQQNAIQYISWICGWGFIRIDEYPYISRTDVLEQIKDYVENHATLFMADETTEQKMGSFIKELLSTLANTIDSMSSTLLPIDESPNIRLPLQMHMPPLSVFELFKKIIQSEWKYEDIEHYCIPSTSEQMIKDELEFFAQNKTLRPYTQHLTGSYLVIYKMLTDDPNADLQQVFYEAMKKSHEITFHKHTHKGLSILKAEVADYINSLEIAVQVPASNDRKQHFEIIRRQLLRNMNYSYQLFLFYKHLEEFKRIENCEQLHIAINNILAEPAQLLLNMLENRGSAELEYHKYITTPMASMFANVEGLHVELCKYVQFKESKLGFPYGMVDIISAHLFQIVLLMMSNVDQETTSKLCFHAFGSVIVDFFYQRVMDVWKADVPVSPYTNYILSKYKPLQKYKINSYAQLTTDPNVNGFQNDIKTLIEHEKLDNSFFDFFLTFNFSFNDRYIYNLESFARKLKSEHNANIHEKTFGRDIIEKLNKEIITAQSAVDNMNEGRKRDPNSIYLYTRKIIFAVIFATGVEEFIKTFKSGTLYNEALIALLSDNQTAEKYE